MKKNFASLFILFIWICVSYSQPGGAVFTGIDVLQQDQFSPLKGKRIGLITNHTGINRDGQATIDLLFNAPEIKLVRLFSPEHGLRGIMDEKVSDETDPKTKLPVISLYGDQRKPSSESITDLDALVFDIQDIGCRFYTYIATMAYAMEAASEAGLEFYVLDRPNPIDGNHVSGFIPPDSLTGRFTSIWTIPTRHGMTVGELARFFNIEMKINAKLTVIAMKNWSRGMYWESTGLPWINPSPNMKSMTGALTYPGLGWLETTSLSMGRGTDIPFEIFGAPYINADQLVRELQSIPLAGGRVIPVKFIPSSAPHKFYQQTCQGIRIIIYDQSKFDAFEFGLKLAATLKRLYPEEFKSLTATPISLGNAIDLAKLNRPGIIDSLIKANRIGLAAFEANRSQYLLYPCMEDKRQLISLEELMSALKTGEEVRAVIRYAKCRLIIDGDTVQAPDAIGGMKLETWEYFAPNSVRNPLAFISCSETVLISHPRYGYVLNYVKLKIFENNTVEITARYLDPRKHKVKMDETFKTTINDGINDGGFYLYPR